MKIKKYLVLALLALVIVPFTKADAAGWLSTLNLPYGTIHTGSSRWYASGNHKIRIDVDGFNTSGGGTSYSGNTTMMLALGDVSTGTILNWDTATYYYGSCVTRNMGSYGTGYRYYSFFSHIYNENTGGYDDYKGIKSNNVIMYPAP